MKKKSLDQSAVFNLRVLIGRVGVLAGVLLTFSSGFAQEKALKPAPNTAHGQSPHGVFQGAGGNFWISTGGPQGADVRAIAVNGSNDIFAGTHGTGVFRLIDGGGSWEEVNNGLLGLNVNSLAINSNGNIFAGTDFAGGGGGVYRSTDNGQSWTEVNQGVITTNVSALAIKASGTIFAGTFPPGGVFRSTDNGQSWTQVNNGLTCAGAILCFAINPQGDIFAGTGGCGVFRSTDDGDNWTQTTCCGFASHVINALGISENSSIFAGAFSRFGIGGGMFRSIDNGDTWTERPIGMTTLDFYSLAVNAADHIFAGAANQGSHTPRVVRSTNNGDDWSEISSGLTGGRVYALAIDVTGFALAGTAGGGVFRSVESAPGATPTPTPSTTPPPPPSATPTPTPSTTPPPPPSPTPTPTPTVTPTTPSPPPSATPTPTPTVTPTTPSPTPSASPTPTSTPTPAPVPAAQALNLSTRMRVLTGGDVGIGGFIITGTAPKHVLVRAIGPSLTQLGVPDALADPVMELHGPAGFVTIINDNWQDDLAQAALIMATGLQPTHNLESAIDATLVPGNYTAVVRGKNNSTGVALVEVYDLDQNALSKLGNISSRAFVSTGDNIMIAGFILGGNSGADRIVVRGIGPSLATIGNALLNPTLELRNSNGALLVFNNDWQDDPDQAAELIAAGLAPSMNPESGIATTLPPGLYSALLAGQNNTSGVGVVEIYDRGAP